MMGNWAETNLCQLVFNFYAYIKNIIAIITNVLLVQKLIKLDFFSWADKLNSVEFAFRIIFSRNHKTKQAKTTTKTLDEIIMQK